MRSKIEFPTGRLAGLVLPVAAAVVVYWPILFLPNIYDTLLHTQLADDLTLATVWLPNEDFGFYRPLVFLPLVLMQDWFGYPAALLQLFNLVQHAINVLLLTILIDRLSGRRYLSAASGFLLALFPFGYQALAIYGNNAYLTVTGFILWGLILGLTGRPTPRRMWGLAVVQLAGFLVHETAALLLPLVGLGLWLDLNSKYEIRNTKYEAFCESLSGGEGRRQTADSGHQNAFESRFLNIERSGESVRVSNWFNNLWSVVWRLRSNVVFRISYFVNYWPASLVWLGYLLFYLTLPRGGGPGLDYGGNALGPKLLLFLQTLAHPFVWFAHLLPDISAQTIILAGALLTLGLAGWAWFRLPARRPLLIFGLGWWIAASLLVGMTLPTYYIADGARLLYPGAPGLAIVWGVFLLPRPIEASGRRNIEKVVLLAGLVFVLATGSQFIGRMIGYYTLVSEPVRAIQEGTRGGRLTPLALVNLPQWVSPPRNTYAIGTEFAPLLGDHLFVGELLRANLFDGLPGPPQVIVLTAPGLRSETSYNVGLFNIRARESISERAHVFVTSYGEGGLKTQMTGALEENKGEDNSPNGSIGPYNLVGARALACPDQVWVKINLKVRDPIPPNISLFVQAIGRDGLIAQADGPPLGVPAARLNWDNYLFDERFIPVGDAKATHILIGAYDFISGERFLAVSAAGEPLPDNAWVIEVEEGCEGR